MYKLMNKLKRIFNRFKQKRIITLIKKSNLFDSSWYLSEYPDIKHSKIDPITHYLNFGASESRNPNASFDSQWYLDNNEDVAASGVNPLLHYVLHGQKEGRATRPSQSLLIKAKSSTKQSLKGVELIQSAPGIAGAESKIGIICHVYYLDVFPDLLSQLKQITRDYKLYLTTPIENKEKLENMMAEMSVSFSIKIVENNGYDLLPFIQSIPELIEDEIDIVCKLHTKKGAANLESIHPEIKDVWANLLTKPLISSPQVVDDIVTAFETDSKLGMVAPASMFKSSKHLMYGNEKSVSQLLLEMESKTDPTTEWGFVAGTMFWCRLEILLPLLKLNLKNTISGGETGTHSSYWHAIERVLGKLPLMANMGVALSFAKDLNLSEFSVAKLNNHYASYINSFGVGLTLTTELNIRSDFDTLCNNLDETQREERYSSALNIESVLYYLRYGVFLGQDVNQGFNSAAYWHYYKDVIDSRLNPLVHFFKFGKASHRISFPSNINLKENKSLIEKSGLFDAEFYLQENPDVASRGLEPLEHFCKFGWKELRDPAANIDIWQLWRAHLIECKQVSNPLTFLLLTEKLKITQKPPIKINSGIAYENYQSLNRVCLFAGYDADGIIDQSVIDYVAELSKYSDVYYLADSIVSDEELQKLKPFTKAAWAFRHGAYDFGSYSKLAINLVGWEVIESYDELILANDSCYIIDSLSSTFNKMDSKKCDWWGMQATKGLSKTKEKPSNCFKENISIDDIKNSYLHDYEQESLYDFHIGSYFIVFRKNVLAGKELKGLLENVHKESNKLNIIRKYEIGLTRLLINSGYNFDTFIDELFTFHPIYTNNHFTLIEQGLPLFKRFFLTENHYHVPQLWQWEDKLQKLKPELDLAPLKDNLYRIANVGKLYRNFNISLLEDGTFTYPVLLTDDEFVEQDKVVEKYDHYWVFPVCAYDNNLTSNDRALFEAVKNDVSIKKIILTRANNVEFVGNNVEICPLQSPQGQQFLLQAKFIFIKHTPRENVLYPLDPKLHYFINLWHGIPLKRIGFASKDLQHILPQISEQHKSCHAVICSSDIDRMAMTSAFHPLTYNDMWVTGLPRIDIVKQVESSLADDLQNELNYIRATLNGRKLIFFCPTFKNGQQGSYYQLSNKEKQQLNKWLKGNNYVLGIREHMADKANSYLANLYDIETVDLGNKRVRNIELIYRLADVLITDYSSCFIDYMVTGKPVISFAYDYDHYIDEERGLFYDLDFAIPGPVSKTFTDLIAALKTVTAKNYQEDYKQQYQLKQQVFFKYTDANNSERLVGNIKALYHKEESEL